MTEFASVQIKGLREVEEFLIDIGAQASGKLLRSAMLRASRGMVAQAKQHALRIRRSGSLYAAIKPVYVQGGRSGGKRGRTLRVSGRDAETFGVVRVGPVAGNKAAIALNNIYYGQQGRRRNIKGIYYGHMLERGTKRMRPQPFLSPAFRSSATQSVQDFSAEIFRRINRIKNRTPTLRKPTGL